MLRRLLPLVLLVALAGPARAYQPINSNISANTSWGPLGSGATVEADVFWVQSSISVDASFTLTLKPGTIVKFSAYTGLTVNGSLQVQGTNINNAFITSIKDDTRGGDTNGDGGATLPAASDWGGITFNSTASPDSSRIAFCDVAYGGYYVRGMLTFNNGVSGRLTNCTLRRSYVGVDCIGTASPLLVDTSIQISTLVPIVMDFTSNPTLLRLSFSNGNNLFDAFGLRGMTLTTAATLPKRGATVGATPYTNITYVLLGGLLINPTGSLTIASGVVIKPYGGSGIDVYGTLTMNGAFGDEIVVTSINDDNYGQPLDTNNNGSITAPNRNDWPHITFYSGAAGSMQYCRLKYGTTDNNSGMVDVTGVNLPISNSTLSDAAHGLAIHGATNPTLTSVAINNMLSTPTLMSVTANPTFTGVTFSANGITALGIIGEQISTNCQLSQRTVAGYANITYYVMTGFLDVLSPFTLTIDPGVVVKFYGASGISIRGTLTANGTVGSPIVFTSEHDDAWGNPSDTNGNGAATLPSPGNWHYIRLWSTAGGSLMNYCRVQFGSQSPYDGYPTSLWINGCSPTISNCNINKGNYGMRIDGAVTPTVGSSDTVTNCTSAPVVMSVQSNPTFTQPYFKTNGANGLALFGETLTGSATIRYRPNVTFQPPDAPTVYAYYLTGDINVPAGMTLVIEPQVVIKHYAGTFQVSGALNAVGSGPGANRVIFTSFKDDGYGGDTNASGAPPSSGDWYTAVQFFSTATSNQCVLRNCLFTFGGGGGPNDAAVITNSTSPKIAQCEFLFNRSALTFKGNSTPSLDSVSVLLCTSIPIAQSLVSDPQYAHMTLSGNTYTVLGLLGENVTQNARTITRSLGAGILNNIAYAPTGNITIGSGATWTINPGVVIKLGRAYYDPVGINIAINGALVADGKPDSLIVLTSMADDAFGGDNNGDGAASQPGATQWGGIDFGSTTNIVATVFDNVRVRYGGFYGYAMSFTNTGPTVSSTFFTSCYSGLYIVGNSSPVFNTVNIDSSSWVPLRMSLVSNPTFNNVQFQKNYLTGIGVVNETIAQDLLWKIRPISGRQNMPYILDGTLGIGLGSTLTLQPGLIVKFLAGYGGNIVVNRACFAQGKSVPESLIVFTSSLDDFYGGRSDSSAFTTAPAPGNWAYVTIMNTAIAGQVKFKNCVFRYGGSGSSYGALRAFSSTPTVDSCTFAFNQVGVSAEGSGNPVIHGSSLYGNNYYAVTNTGTSFCTDATGCWWGAANGPNDSNAAADVCGAGQTNAGSGDAVTNNVNYSSYATSGLLNPLLGDVSLNGYVRAYDASLILQFLVPSIPLTTLQQTVADVDNTGIITTLDASLILQLIVGNIPALPGNYMRVGPSSPDVLAVRAVVERARGVFEVALGDPRRQDAEWLLPVRVSGTAPIYGAEIKLEGPAASGLSGVEVSGGAMVEYGTPGGAAKVVFAAAAPIPPGEMVMLHFPADGSADWTPPEITWARVNNEELTFGQSPPPAVPKLAFLARPAPNPATGPLSVTLGVSAREAGAPAQVVVFDLAGRRVRLLHQGPLQAGVHPFTWDLRDADGRLTAPGVYLVHAEAGRFSAVRRLVVVR